MYTLAQLIHMPFCNVSEVNWIKKLSHYKAYRYRIHRNFRYSCSCITIQFQITCIANNKNQPRHQVAIRSVQLAQRYCKILFTPKLFSMINDSPKVTTIGCQPNSVQL